MTAVQDHPFEAEAARGNSAVHDLGDGAYYTEGGWGLNEPKTGTTTGTAGTARLQKEYRWDDRNRLRYSNDGHYSVRYAYGEDGQRTGKWVNSNVGGESESLYFGKLWTWHYDGMSADYTGMNSKHIFVGETRIATKVVYADGSFIRTAEEERQFYYHSDHLGSAQLITDWRGQEYERLEYTPYGELWVEKASAASALDIPYRFTGKERDKETGLYYYGARYLDPRDSRWLSVDPALGEYVPVAPVNDEAKKHNQNLPGMGGVFNTVNLHVYHYAGNNPVKYVDPDGKDTKAATVVFGFAITDLAIPDPTDVVLPYKLAGYIVVAAVAFVFVKTKAEELSQTRTQSIHIHHIATDKNSNSSLRGGPWTPRFAELFAEGGLTLNIPENKVPVAGHGGPHPELYHDTVFTMLTVAVYTATQGLEKGSQEYKTAAADAIKSTLTKIGAECATPGTYLNTLLTHGIPGPDY